MSSPVYKSVTLGWSIINRLAVEMWKVQTSEGQPVWLLLSVQYYLGGGQK